jgi:hypothetical protein
MAAFENWHLQRGCLKPADASVFDIGGNQPAYINRHMDPMLGPTGITDLAKEEMFGGGRRTVQRPGGSKEEVPPYGVGAYVPFVPPPPSQTREERHALIAHGRRRSLSLDDQQVATSLEMPAHRKQPPRNPVSTQWRTGDDEPFALIGRAPRRRPNQAVVDTSWRGTVDERVGGYLGGGGAKDWKPPDDYQPDTLWRTGDQQPLQLVTSHAPQPRPGPGGDPRLTPRFVAVRDSRWRRGDEGCHLGGACEMIPEDQLRSARNEDVNVSNWRVGDDYPLRIDGVVTKREPLDPRKTSRMPRDITRPTDSQPWTINGEAPTAANDWPESLSGGRLVAAPSGLQAGRGALMPKEVKESVRTRRITKDWEEGARKLMDIRPLEEVVLSVRNKELKMGDWKFVR